MENYLFVKAWLTQVLLPSTGKLSWVITSRKRKPVSILGSLVEGANYSEFVPGAPSTTVGTKIHTIFLNNCTDEIAEQYRAHAQGSIFYLGVSSVEDEEIKVLTPKQYEEHMSSSDFSDARTQESAQ